MIILAILLFIALYFLYVYLLANGTSPPQKNLKNDSVGSIAVVDTKINEEPSYYNTYRYSYAVWVNVKNLSNQNDKSKFATQNASNNIMYLNDTGGNANTTGWSPAGSNDATNKNDNTKVYFSLDLYSDTSAYVSLAGLTKRSTLITSNFPLQKWTYVIISFDNKTVDLYLDGKLVRSLTLDKSPTPINAATSTMTFGKADVDVMNYTRYNYTMDPQTAWNNYKAGLNTTGGSTSYKLNLHINKDNQPLGYFGKIPLF